MPASGTHYPRTSSPNRSLEFVGVGIRAASRRMGEHGLPVPRQHTSEAPDWHQGNLLGSRSRLVRACGEQICRTVPKDSVVARRCRGMGPVIVPGVDGGELVRAQFLAFYDAAVGPLFGYLYRASGGQRELAEDLCQDVFATVLTRVRGGDVSVLTVPWVIAVGRNRLIDQWRRSARQERRLSQLFTNQPVATASVDDDLLAWIAQLPASQRAAVVLHYLDDLPVHEVATRLGKSYKSTESLLSRARQSLRTSGGGDHV